MDLCTYRGGQRRVHRASNTRLFSRASIAKNRLACIFHQEDAMNRIRNPWRLSSLATAILFAGLFAACGGDGGDGGGGGQPPATIFPRFAYVTNIGSDTVSQYVVDSVTGQLRPNGYVSTGDHPSTVTVDPSGRTAYVANFRSHTVSQYSVGSTGTLTPLSPPTVSAGTGPLLVTVDPSGRTAYVANADSHTISQYRISATG
ncbi:MAG: lactonase family protein [Nitrospira sp. CG24A]|nr:MAG: lactonase family protein [Nitrospira sp. CG24A]